MVIAARFCMPRLLLTVLIVFLVSPVPDAQAQSPLAPDSWFVTPSIGMAFDSDADVSLSVAGAAAYPITGALAVEGELGHLFDLAPGDADVDSSLTTVHADLLYFFDSEFVAVPYIAGGLGVGRFSHEVTRPPASINQTEIGFNLGGGVTYLLGQRAWIRGDFRYFKHIDDVPSAWRFSAGVSLRVGE
jgi:opacity protein-like surface antigen